MPGLSLFLLAFIVRSINSSSLLDLPLDLTNRVFSHFDIGEKVSYVSTLNKQFNKQFNQKHAAEIKNVKIMKTWFENNEFSDHLNEIGVMCSKLRMSELYHIHLPTILATIQGYWSTGMLGNSLVTQVLTKMRLFPLSLPEFNSDTSLSDASRLLLLASRSLINYFAPNWFANTNVGPLEYQPYRNGIPPFNYWSNFIWLRPDHSDAFFAHVVAPEPNAFETDLWPIYFSYVYEFYFNALNNQQSSLSVASIFHLEGKAKSTLMRLIKENDFVPWTQSTLRQIRSDFHDCDVHLLYSDFHRIDMSLRYHQMTADDRYKFRTFLVIQSLEDGHCSIPGEPSSQMAFKRDLLDMIYWNWCGYHEEYEKLIKILSGFLYKVDPFIVGFVNDQGGYTNDTFACELMYRLWEMNGLDVREYENGFKEMVINGIINKSKYFWNENNRDAAKEEISKLAHTKRFLFDKNALVLLIANAEETDVTGNDFLIECLLLLTELRSDWDLDTATDKAKTTLIKEILMVQNSVV